MATPTFDCKITTPMALNETNSAKGTLRWFVHGAEYDPRAAEIRFLVNGQRAFGSIYQDILDAKHTVDIICWGFQPSMYFVRDGGKSMRIGELLAHKGEKDNVKVRLLCWHDPLYIAEGGENNMPGFDRKVTALKHLPDSWFQKVPIASPDYQTWSETEFDMYWYARADLNNVTHTVHKSWTDGFLSELVTPHTMSDGLTRALGHPVAGFKNIELATRSFDPSERTEIIARVKARGKAAGWSQKLIKGMCQGMGVLPTHHQKTVLIDYEYPDIAVGYIMGHNMLDQYWDNDEHKAKPATPKTGRSGPTPWQDISSRITGPVLQDINANFCQAWDKATGQKLAEARKKLGVEGKHELCLGGSTGAKGVMAQVLRTQSQESKTEIGKLYLQALNNATQYVFVQNQYFRWDEFADTIKLVAKKHYAAGRDPGADGPIYLFVITNSTDAAVGPGTYSTYEMLDSLGYRDRMPGVKYAEADDKLVAKTLPLEGELAKAQEEEKRMSTQSYDWSQLGGVANYIADLRGQQGVLSGEIGDIQKQRAQLKQELGAPVKIDPGAQIVSPKGAPILKVLICTLVATDSPPSAWVPVYVHAKLGIIDDAFTTLGSANINFRSMNVDSEINIALENGRIASGLRQQLWELHTRGADPGAPNVGSQPKTQDSVNASGINGPKDAFKAWTNIITQNNGQRDAHGAPLSSLVEFFRSSQDRSYND